MSDSIDPKDHAEAVAVFRSQVIGACARRELHRGELKAALEALSQQRFRPPGAKYTRTYSVPTLERWLYAYRRGGLAALRPQPRCDRGRAQNLTTEQRELLLDIRRENPSASVPLILHTLVTDGRLAKGAVGEATVRRLYAEHGLDRATLRHGTDGKVRLRWQAERPGALWQGDVCHGPSLRIDGRSRPLRIHALIDDASRFIVALEAHHTEQEIDMLGVFVRALRRHPAPGALYLDNGSTYRGETLALACNRLDMTLIHGQAYDAPARGKIERFWRHLRENCLNHLSALSSLHDVQVRLLAFLDRYYHGKPHGGLMGRTPAEVFETLDLDDSARRVSETELKKALTVRRRARVSGANTVSVRGAQWQTDAGFLARKVVTVAYPLHDLSEPPWIEYKGQTHHLQLVDPIANARRKRAPNPSSTTATRTRPFDPTGALLDQATGRNSKHKEHDDE